jgi:hypothetical protein
LGEVVEGGRGGCKGGCGWHSCLKVGEARWLGSKLEGHLDVLLSQTVLQGTCTLTCRVSQNEGAHYCQIVGYVYALRLSHCF